MQRKALHDAQLCRTAALGGHLHRCTNCRYEHPAYNSCLNRHCPTCQATRQASQVRERMDRVLPVPHFHVVCERMREEARGTHHAPTSLPEQLRGVARANPKRIYGLLFTAARITLARLAKQRLDAQLGVTAVLHTWTREMHFHPHLHCVVTGGGLALDGSRWVGTRGRYLFPVRLMGAVFRRYFMKHLQAMRQAGKLAFVGPADKLADDKAFERLVRRMYRTKWVVYAKKPFAGPSDVFTYLGRYTHRVAISDYRLLHVDNDRIRFRTRGGEHVDVTPQQFIARWLLHMLPSGFHKIRHFGLYSSSGVRTRLPVARALLGAKQPERAEEPRPWTELAEELLGRHPLTCPRCGTPEIVLVPLPRPARRSWLSSPAALDTS